MAWDDGLVEILRDDLAGEQIGEKRMFGGNCFLLNGNMVCGTYQGGAMFRVGPEGNDAALKVRGTANMVQGGKPMKGFITLSEEATGDDPRRLVLLGLALACARALPAKAAASGAATKQKRPAGAAKAGAKARSRPKAR